MNLPMPMLQFHYYIKRLLVDAFSSPETTPEAIASYILSAQKRPVDKREVEPISKIITERKIQHLVHFTHIENIPKILKYGLIPRKYLDLEAIRIAVNPRVSDPRRLDNRRQENCLSITHPNYEMFYKKRVLSKNHDTWGVILIDASVMTEFFFEFTKGNSASSDMTPVPGSKGLSNLFIDETRQNDQYLNPNETIDPQAEALEDSILPPSRVRDVKVQSEKAAQYLAKKGVQATVDFGYFKERNYSKKNSKMASYGY